MVRTLMGRAQSIAPLRAMNINEYKRRKGHNMNMNEFMIRNENIMNYIDTNIEKGSQGCIYTN